MNPVQLSLFASRMDAICEEMGVVLRRASMSTNIKDRLDYSCAVFDVRGRLCAQAAHIPVHLGSMAWAMSDIVDAMQWQPGDVVVANDPYLGGTHLPDITMISPLFRAGELLGFAVNRAHHAHIGASTPGSMPVSSRLDEEGVVIPPTHLLREGKLTETAVRLLAPLRGPSDPQIPADFSAQISSNRRGLVRLQELLDGIGLASWQAALGALQEYGVRMAEQALRALPNGEWRFTDYMDDDGQGNERLPIRVRLRVETGRVDVDFSGTAPQVPGNINCPLSVTAAAVYYVFRCLMPEGTPACAGSFANIHVTAPSGCLVNAESPAAVAAGNVETSTRIVDVLLGALAQAIPGRIPAASHGSMNNVAMGHADADGRWDYYETIGGGMGAGPDHDGLSAIQTHMTNTLNTPVESLEAHYPLRVMHYALRSGSGGAGRKRGGDGLIRSYQFLAPAQVSVLSERRLFAPWGLHGGGEGMRGENRLNGEPMPGKFSVPVKAGDCLEIMTAGGGGLAPPQAGR